MFPNRTIPRSQSRSLPPSPIDAMRPAILVILTFGTPVLGETATQSRPTATENDDIWCGPRCVQFVLQSCGHEVELPDVLDHIETPAGRGSSLHDMHGLLDQYGLDWNVYYVKRRVDWLAALGHPSIVHLTRDDADVGHFVVALEARDGIVSVWDGTAGVATVPTDRLARRMSGYVLAPQGRGHVSSRHLTALILGGMSLLGGACVALVRLRRAALP